MKNPPLEPSLQKLPRFVRMMRDRLIASFYKYGPADQNAKLQSESGTSMLAGAKKRIEKYEQTGNTEWLVDAANFCLLEWAWPAHPEAHFRATDSRESPGPPSLTVREIERLNEENRGA
jgi:hypothetical protein